MYNSDIPSRAELPTSRQLLRSTLIAIVAALAILITIVLPAEYNIDPTGVGRVLGLAQMGEIKVQLAEEAARDRQMDQNSTVPAPGSSLLGRVFAALVVSPASAQTASRQDVTTLTLTPGQGAEIKLVMKAGAKADYSWTVSGGVVNFDTHGDGGGKSISYEKGRAVPGDDGVLEAAFDGNHGWFWRNRGSADVTLTLKTSGAYAEIKRPD
ncbi:transmembrane anchor protein [Ancylobacter polymorphus]|uniref:Transmembrane anchor protein n=1 Tax=Ancylobacter polymorphus TaxID=223390 RepID=A0ABU0BJD3_9HYPH|nr:transmembrane anchor protein [Ancylobacter polymorphus]MDQ0305426.1 hypothetical protein [Ancylobacter polymorphus]